MDLYRYRMSPLKVIDGDTIKASVDLGFSLRIIVKLRLTRIDAPEHQAQPGHLAHEKLELLLADALEWIVETKKPDSFGRWLAEIYSMDGTRNINDEMLASGLVVPYTRK
jgi:endonuclease YncB( thermonuclease family)